MILAVCHRRFFTQLPTSVVPSKSTVWHCRSSSARTEAWSPWAEGGVVRREGDEIRLVVVLVQVVLRCVHIVFFFGTCFGIQVTVGGSKRDAKQLLPYCEKLIPSDAPNHDDWNELFNEPAKLEDKLIFNDGSNFFMSDPVERFGVLDKVEWTESLRGSKTHRELHTMWGLFASTHRVWFFHTLIARRCSAFKRRWCVARW